MSDFTINVVMAKPKRKPAAPKPAVFERYIANAIDAIITEKVDTKTKMAVGSRLSAQLRFQEGKGLAKARAAYNWRVVGHNRKPKDRIPGEDEIVSVYVKAGSKIVPILKNGETGEDNQAEITIPSENVVPVMDYFVEMLKGLDKTSPKGKKFHEAAIEGSAPRFRKGMDKEYSYDKRIDDWVTHQPVKKGSEVVETSAKVAKAWREANKDAEHPDFPFGWKPKPAKK